MVISITENSCATFTLTSDCYTVYLHKPEWNSAHNKIAKNLQRFSFWTENYKVHDQDIDNQPLVLTGTESWEGIKKSGICAPFCAPLCVRILLPEFYSHFRHLHEIMDNHEEITISGLGECIDAVYVIKDLKIDTIPGSGLTALKWTMTLEKVRNS